MERRESPRAEVALSCRIEEPAGFRGAMVTENISRGGVLLRLDTGSMAPPRLEPGRLVTVEIQLPVHHAFGGKCMHCQGSVARVSPGAAGILHVAVRVLRMEFRASRIEAGMQSPVTQVVM